MTRRLLNTDDVGVAVVAEGDSRLSNSRTPTAHTHGLADITDEGALASLNTVGTSQIDAAAVTYAKIQDVSAASKLLGRGDSGSGDVEEITLGTNLSMSGTTLNASGGGGLSDGDYGDITVGGGGTTLTIDAAAVTFAKMQGIAGGKLVGRTVEGIGTGDMQEITLGTNLSMTGATLNAAGGGLTQAQALARQSFRF